MATGKSKPDAKQIAKVGAGCAIALSALIAICAILIPHELQKMASRPTEGKVAEPVIVKTDEGDATEVAGIDWDYWLVVNPDIVGWITIPDTPIDYPIVQAHANNPTHYLNYDAYDNYNIYGCLYVDAGCTIESPNVVIFGHNMGGIDDSMFTTLTGYLDSGYMAEHQAVIIQTPADNRILKVRAADSVSPYGYEKRNTFSSVEGLREFYLELWEGADAKCSEPGADEVEQLFTLITCDEGGATRAVVCVG